jgi:hypothetical protein
MQNGRNIMCLARSGFGLELRAGYDLALTICRQLCEIATGDEREVPLRRLTKAFGLAGPALRVRGAIERVLWLSPQSWVSNVCSGLLRNQTAATIKIGAMNTWALAGWKPTGVADAGASKTRRLAGILQAVYRASLFEGGRYVSPQPCMNELPAHAKNPIYRYVSAFCLCRGTNRTGVQNLF